jgi:hypothetical protein
MSDGDHDDLGALFERVTGESTVTEPQQDGPSHRPLDRTR